MRRGLALGLRLGVVAVLVVVVAGLALHLEQRVEARRAAQTAAAAPTAGLDATTAAVSLVFSFDWRNLDAARARVADLGTDTFRTRYQQTFDTSTVPSATAQHLIQTARVDRAGLVAATADSVDVLVLVDFRVRRETDGTSADTPGLLRVRAELDEGRWRIGEVNPA